MAFVENLDVFMNADTPGYVLVKILGKTIGGLFNQGYSSGDIGFSNIEAILPELICKQSDIVEVEHGTECWIAEMRYEVAGLQPDGHGLTALLLKK